MSQSLAEKLKKHRKLKGYSLQKFGELTNTTKSYIWELENPHPKKLIRPSAVKLMKLAKVLSVSLDYLMNSSDDLDDQDIKTVLFVKFNQLSLKDKRRIESIIDIFIDDTD